jgi:putative restriction endonuclease
MPRDDASQVWRSALSDLHTWKCRGQRAVHKPLLSLMLIARAATDGGNEVHFTEIESRLEQLLREFGPSRKSYHPEYPFWHLQTDGFWRIRGGDDLPMRTGASNPTRRTFRSRDVVGCVPEGLWKALADDASLRVDLTERLLDSFWPETRHAAIRSAIGLSDESETGSGSRQRAPRDPRFRDHVLRAYERRCAICGYDGRLADSLLGLEAAHVKWHAYDGPDDVANGLALCAFHHMAFDAGALGLSDSLTILVSADVGGQSQVDELLLNFSSNPLRPPQATYPPPDQRFVRWHQKEVFKGPARGVSYELRGKSVAMAADQQDKGVDRGS